MKRTLCLLILCLSSQVMGQILGESISYKEKASTFIACPQLQNGLGVNDYEDLGPFVESSNSTPQNYESYNFNEGFSFDTWKGLKVKLNSVGSVEVFNHAYDELICIYAARVNNSYVWSFEIRKKKPQGASCQTKTENGKKGFICK